MSREGAATRRVCRVPAACCLLLAACWVGAPTKPCFATCGWRARRGWAARQHPRVGLAPSVCGFVSLLLNPLALALSPPLQALKRRGGPRTRGERAPQAAGGERTRRGTKPTSALQHPRPDLLVRCVRYSSRVARGARGLAFPGVTGEGREKKGGWERGRGVRRRRKLRGGL